MEHGTLTTLRFRPISPQFACRLQRDSSSRGLLRKYKCFEKTVKTVETDYNMSANNDNQYSEPTPAGDIAVEDFLFTDHDILMEDLDPFNPPPAYLFLTASRSPAAPPQPDLIDTYGDQSAAVSTSPPAPLQPMVKTTAGNEHNMSANNEDEYSEPTPAADIEVENFPDLYTYFDILMEDLGPINPPAYLHLAASTSPPAPLQPDMTDIYEDQSEVASTSPPAPLQPDMIDIYEDQSEAVSTSPPAPLQPDMTDIYEDQSDAVSTFPPAPLQPDMTDIYEDQSEAASASPPAPLQPNFFYPYQDQSAAASNYPAVPLQPNVFYPYQDQSAAASTYPAVPLQPNVFYPYQDQSAAASTYPAVPLQPNVFYPYQDQSAAASTYPAVPLQPYNSAPTAQLPGGIPNNLVPVGTLNGQLVYVLQQPNFVPSNPAPPPPPPPQSTSRSRKRQREDHDEDRPYVKKPPNAFMLYMKEQRPNFAAEMSRSGSAEVNTILAQMWKMLSDEDQAIYFQMADIERQLHARQHPDWSSRENYGRKRKRDRSKSWKSPEASASTPTEVTQQAKRLRVTPVFTSVMEAPHTETAETEAAHLQEAEHRDDGNETSANVGTVDFIRLLFLDSSPPSEEDQ